MKRQPRNPQTDKLVNERLISMAYGQIGAEGPWGPGGTPRQVSAQLSGEEPPAKSQAGDQPPPPGVGDIHLWPHSASSSDPGPVFAHSPQG